MKEEECECETVKKRESLCFHQIVIAKEKVLTLILPACKEFGCAGLGRKDVHGHSSSLTVLREEMSWLLRLVEMEPRLRRASRVMLETK